MILNYVKRLKMVSTNQYLTLKYIYILDFSIDESWKHHYYIFLLKI